jgi:hypothetical protein
MLDDVRSSETCSSVRYVKLEASDEQVGVLSPDSSSFLLVCASYLGTRELLFLSRRPDEGY